MLHYKLFTLNVHHIDSHYDINILSGYSCNCNCNYNVMFSIISSKPLLGYYTILFMLAQHLVLGITNKVLFFQLYFWKQKEFLVFWIAVGRLFQVRGPATPKPQSHCLFTLKMHSIKVYYGNIASTEIEINLPEFVFSGPQSNSWSVFGPNSSPTCLTVRFKSATDLSTQQQQYCDC